MRMRAGRPDLRRHAERFGLPAVTPDSTLRVTFMGVSTLLISDGTTHLMTDGFFTRPGLARLLTRPLRSDPRRVARGLERAGVDRLAAVLPVHTHFDHALDSVAVAQRTGASVVGGRSAAQLALGQGLAADRVVTVGHGQQTSWGAFDVVHLESRHSPPDRFPGEIDRPLRLPARVGAFQCGETWSVQLTHRGPDRTRRLLVQGSAGFVPGALDGQSAEVVYLGVGQLGVQAPSYIRDYWQHTVRAVGARRVVLIHWDDFFRSAELPLRALPFAGDDLDAAMALLQVEADRDGVDLRFPDVWSAADPWAGLG